MFWFVLHLVYACVYLCVLALEILVLLSSSSRNEHHNADQVSKEAEEEYLSPAYKDLEDRFACLAQEKNEEKEKYEAQVREIELFSQRLSLPYWSRSPSPSKLSTIKDNYERRVCTLEREIKEIREKNASVSRPSLSAAPPSQPHVEVCILLSTCAYNTNRG